MTDPAPAGVIAVFDVRNWSSVERLEQDFLAWVLRGKRPGDIPVLFVANEKSRLFATDAPGTSHVLAKLRSLFLRLQRATFEPIPRTKLNALAHLYLSPKQQVGGGINWVVLDLLDPAAQRRIDHELREVFQRFFAACQEGGSSRLATSGGFWMTTPSEAAPPI